MRRLVLAREEPRVYRTKFKWLHWLRMELRVPRDKKDALCFANYVAPAGAK